MIVKKRFWIREKDDLHMSLSYADPRTTKGYHTKYGGDLVEQLEVDADFDDEVVSIIKRAGAVEFQFKVYVQKKSGEVIELLRCTDLKTANDVAKALGHCYSVVYVTKI